MKRKPQKAGVHRAKRPRSWNSKEKHDYSGEGGRLRRVAELAAELQAFSDQGFREGRWR